MWEKKNAMWFSRLLRFKRCTKLTVIKSISVIQIRVYIACLYCTFIDLLFTDIIFYKYSDRSVSQIDTVLIKCNYLFSIFA